MDGMRFAILGPLRLDIGGREITITAPRVRTLLAMLLVYADRPVSQERLIDAIWSTKPPQNARNQLQGAVSRLRTQLAEAGVTSQLIVTEAAGYRVSMESADLDVTEFRRLVAQARVDASAGRHDDARSAYQTALGLWRGAALAGIDSHLVRQAAVTLDEERTQAQEERFDAELAAGAAGELIPELTDLVHQHRHRERLHRALMLALYRAGRQADALAAFRSARELLHDELGTEPGAELRRLHQAILNRDPTIDATPRSTPSAPATPTPRELPADVAGFTGRGDALEALGRLLSDHQAATGPVVISAVAGTAGVGKTALAIHWAHQVADRFPDGQLFVNLRGYDPDQPITSAAALARLLTALGVASQDIPVELDDRAGRYRSAVAGRRMLIVLDNAATVEQVSPLLPGSGTCMVVVTSRDNLAGLVARHGARRFDLGLLPPEDAVDLLRKLIGPRVDAEPEATGLLIEQCARLPLALRVAAELAASRPTVPLADLAGELGDRQRRLDLLAAGDDPYAAVKVVFSWSIRHLPPETIRTFRLLGLHPGQDFDPYAAAALTDSSIEQAQRTLEQLVRAGLVHPTSPRRFGFHDLLRAYAAHIAATEENESERRAALDRLFDYYLAAAAAAMDSWHPAEAHRRPRTPPPTTAVPDLAEPATARAWLEGERSCLLAVAAHTATQGWPTHSIRLSSILHRYLQGGGHYTNAVAIHGHAYQAAEQLGDITEQAHALRYLGGTYMQMGRPEPATDHLERALAMFQQVGDQAGEATALNNLGVIEERLSNYQAAAEKYQQALARFRNVVEPAGEANTVNGLGVIEERLGRYQPAADHYREALSVYQRIGDETGAAMALTNLGNAEERLGRHSVAADCQHRALAVFRSRGNRQGEAHALSSLGSLELRLDRPQLASGHLEEALAVFRDIGDQQGEAWVLNGLGEVALAVGDLAAALAHQTSALAVASATDFRDQQARAHAGLGNACHSLGDVSAARAHYEQALVLYTELGMPEAEDVRDRLTALDQPSGPAAT